MFRKKVCLFEQRWVPSFTNGKNSETKMKFPGTDWPSKSTLTTHLRGHKRAQNNIWRTAGLNCLSYGQSSWFSNKKRTGQKLSLGTFHGKNHCWPKKNIRDHLTFAHKHVDPQDFWGNNLWNHETKVELFGWFESHYICHSISLKNKTKKHTHCQTRWWLGVSGTALLLRDLGDLQ